MRRALTHANGKELPYEKEPPSGNDRVEVQSIDKARKRKNSFRKKKKSGGIFSFIVVRTYKLRLSTFRYTPLLASLTPRLAGFLNLRQSVGFADILSHVKHMPAAHFLLPTCDFGSRIFRIASLHPKKRRVVSAKDQKTEKYVKEWIDRGMTQ